MYIVQTLCEDAAVAARRRAIWLKFVLFIWRRTQAVRERSAKPLCNGSIPFGALHAIPRRDGFFFGHTSAMLRYMEDPDSFDTAALVVLANARMPFGKYAGRLLIDLPEAYVVWFSHKGFPKGTIGEQLKSLYTIKENGLEPLLRPLVVPEH